MERIADIKISLPEFEPIVPYWTGHSQTLLSHMMPHRYTRQNWVGERIILKDGDELYVEYIDRGSRYTLSVYHGLSGNSSSDYMQATAELGLKRGWNVVLVNHRGAHAAAQSKKSYHSGRGDDASDVLQWSRRRFAGSMQIAVGFSMSGSILLNLLTGLRGEVLPDAAVIINAPLNLAKASQRLMRGASKLYDLRFYFRLRRLIRKRADIEMPLIGTTWDVDELYTSKVNGFKDALDYYENCSTYQVLHKISKPTFILSSYDDPFIDIQDYIAGSWPASVHRTFLKSGGHMGYLNKYQHSVHGRRWMMCYIDEVLTAIESVLQTKN